MPQLDRETYEAIFDLLMNDMLTGTDDARYTLFFQAFMGIEPQPRIDVRAGTQDIAVTRMIHGLVKFGDIGTKAALWLLLEEVQRRLGVDIVEQIAALEAKVNVRDLTLSADIGELDFVRRAASARASLYTHADDVEYQAREGLIGRDTLKQRIMGLLQGDYARVLLQGFGGVGKTALAAQIAVDWLQTKGGAVLWLRLGSDEIAVALEALAHPFNATQAVAASRDADKPKVIRQLLRDRENWLVVLDDAWDGATLAAVETAIPRHIPLLVTSRHQYTTLKRIESIPDLAPDDALQLLRSTAGDTLTADEAAARKLCDKLGHLAFAVELAGRMMQESGYPAQKLLDKLQTADVTQTVKVELGDVETGRETTAALIQTTLDVLPIEAKSAFIAWGAFWSTSITVKMLSLYFERTANTSASPSEAALNKLRLYGLATYVAAVSDNEGRPVTVDYYQLHDLAYAFATAQNTDEHRFRALDACLKYTQHHNQAKSADFATLEPELDNCLGATAFAMQHQHYSKVEKLSENLYGYGEPGFLYHRGYYTQALDLQKQAAVAAEKRGDREAQRIHLSNLGIAYDSLGYHLKALDCHRQVLIICRQMHHRLGEAIELNHLGNVYNKLQQFDTAIDYYQQALEISRDEGYREGEGIQLHNLGHVYNSQQQFDTAIDYYQQALLINQQILATEQEKSNIKLNIGTILVSLGDVHSNLQQFDTAIDYLQQALKIYRSREIDNKHSEAICLYTLGLTYESMEDYRKALDYYEQVLAIEDNLQVPHLIEQTEHNLQRVQAKLAGGSAANSSPTDED